MPVFSKKEVYRMCESTTSNIDIVLGHAWMDADNMEWPKQNAGQALSLIDAAMVELAELRKKAGIS